jgi:hypothetical protein
MDFDPRDSDSRERERDDDRERTLDSRDVFARDMNLPHGLEREIVRHRDREYTLHERSHDPMLVISVPADDHRSAMPVIFRSASNRG